MNIELNPKEITITAIIEQINYFTLNTGDLPKFINFTLRQHQELDRIMSHQNGKGWSTLHGIPILIQGVPVK